MTDPDQTLVLPRQHEPADDLAELRSDPWESPGPARGSAPVGALGSTEAALARVAWLLTVVVVGAVTLVRAGWASLSADELATWATANTTWSQLWELRAELDALTVAYDAGIRGWAEAFGSSEFSLRAPSVAATVAAAGMTAALVSRLVSPRAGLLAGLLFAAVPAVSRYAHEAGPEALALAFGVVATAALAWFFDRPGWWRAAGYLGAVVLLGLAHGAALLLLLGHAGAVLLLRRRVLLAWLPLALAGAAPAVALQFAARPVWQPPPEGADPSGMPSVPELAGVMFGLAVVGGAVAGLALLAASWRRPAGLFTAAALLPFAGAFPAVQYGVPVPVLVMITVPYWFCLAACALHRVPLVRGVAVVTAVALVGVPTQLAVRADDGHGLASRQVAHELAARAQPGDAIIYGPTPADGRIGRDLLARYGAGAELPADVLAVTLPRTGGRVLAVECADVEQCLGNAPRVWLFRADTDPDPLAGLPAVPDGLLRVRYELVRTWTFTGASLALFTRAPDEFDRPEPR